MNEINKNWYDDVSDEKIKQLQNNKTVFGLLDTEDRNILVKAAGQDLVEHYTLLDWRLKLSCDLISSSCYRIKPDFKKPEPEKQKGRWEYYNIFKDFFSAHNYAFRRKSSEWKIHYAFSMIGFGGIEFKENPGRWYMYLPLITQNIAQNIGLTSPYCAESEQSYKPATPLRVRFWVEGEE